MSLSKPINQDPNNSGSFRPTFLGDASVPNAPTASPLSQIRGISRKGSTGAGIPKHVSNVGSNLSPASTGMTSAVSVTYSRDPGDTSHEKVNVYVKGYQGNNSPVQIASGSESPVTFVLNNTGETVSFMVQAQGNSGAAPLTTAPSTGVQIPKSSGGGYGTGTNTGVSVTPTPTTGQLTKFTGAASIGGANLSGDVTTANSVATTVGKIQTIPVSVVTPTTDQVLKYSGSQWQGDWDTPRIFGYNMGIPGTHTYGYGFNTGSIAENDVNLGGTSVVPTGNNPRGTKYLTAGVNPSSASFTINGMAGNANGIPINLNTLRAIKFVMLLNQTATLTPRMWLGLSDSVTEATFRSDTPAVNFVGFRFSTTTDTKWKCVTQTGAANQTATAETGSHLDTSIHIFELRFDGTNVIFFIDGVQVGSQSTNVPSGTAELGIVAILDNKASVNQPAFQLYGFRGIQTY